MSEKSSMADSLEDGFYLDILGQQPMLNNIYTHVCLCFEVSDSSSYTAIFSRLQNGLGELAASFPWIAGQVINEGAGDGNTGVFKVKSFKTPQLIINDLRQDASMPSMSEIKAARFPFRMLDETVLGPRKTLPDRIADDFPVLILQANIITGGLLLDILGEHGMMDIAGQDQIIHLLAKACRSEPFTSDELSAGNLSRRTIIPIFEDDYAPGPELKHQIVKKIQGVRSSDEEKQAATPPRCRWVYFGFHIKALAAIKSLAMNNKGNCTQYVTTNDALCAFIWQSIIRSRMSRLGPEMLTTTFARTVDVRRYLGIPKEYPGILQNMTYNSYTTQQLVQDETLGSIASDLRAAVDPDTCDISFRTRAMATLLERSPDKNVISMTASLDQSMNIIMSSWASIKCPTEDFGPELGQPEAVRIPSFLPVEGMFYLLPEMERYGGGLIAGLCIRDDDLEDLKEDVEWTKYATYIG
ncbi:Trichothecene 3-O-acetyltransferase [Cladobotryum mycophilum]|uniref:Trichothecene 3-O-acetyltransferase n=1 Tax=Cladobotryum mycophilum TaxID=491253 RepID=A0ABR0S997_9HYPO